MMKQQELSGLKVKKNLTSIYSRGPQRCKLAETQKVFTQCKMLLFFETLLRCTVISKLKTIISTNEIP